MQGWWRPCHLEPIGLDFGREKQYSKTRFSALQAPPRSTNRLGELKNLAMLLGIRRCHGRLVCMGKTTGGFFCQRVHTIVIYIVQCGQVRELLLLVSVVFVGDYSSIHLYMASKRCLWTLRDFGQSQRSPELLYWVTGGQTRTSPHKSSLIQ